MRVCIVISKTFYVGLQLKIIMPGFCFGWKDWYNTLLPTSLWPLFQAYFCKKLQGLSYQNISNVCGFKKLTSYLF
jgi:hypothetical protein